jgi:hypothetical protein
MLKIKEKKLVEPHFLSKRVITGLFLKAKTEEEFAERNVQEKSTDFQMAKLNAEAPGLTKSISCSLKFRDNG